jgi:hypothetical protein
MTDMELALHLNLSPAEAEKVIPNLRPEQRAAFERMAGLTKEIAAYVAGTGPKPKGVHIDEQRPRKRKNR